MNKLTASMSAFAAGVTIATYVMSKILKKNDALYRAELHAEKIDAHLKGFRDGYDDGENAGVAKERLRRATSR